ncbi:MAG: rhomboid family intramembrane serine protease [Lachnospiraceae bacterium]|nr:rhomboid family intramembrane serine protease [Lachnospiraceae bacterium]
MWNYSDSDVGSEKKQAFDDLSDLDRPVVTITESQAKAISRKQFLTGSGGGGFWDSMATDRRDIYLTYALIVVNVIVYILQLMFTTPDGVDVLAEYGCQDWPDVVGRFQVYRLFTCMLLHGSWSHLIGNMLVLYIVGYIMEHRISRKRLLIVYIMGGLGSSLVSMFVHHFFPIVYTLTWYGIPIETYEIYDVRSLGASGAIAGVLGAVLFKIIFMSKTHEVEDEGAVGIIRVVVISLLAFGAVYFLRYMFAPEIGVDNAGHVGGTIFGALTMFVFMLIEYHYNSETE